MTYKYFSLCEKASLAYVTLLQASKNFTLHNVPKATCSFRESRVFIVSINYRYLLIQSDYQNVIERNT